MTALDYVNGFQSILAVTHMKKYVFHCDPVDPYISVYTVTN